MEFVAPDVSTAPADVQKTPTVQQWVNHLPPPHSQLSPNQVHSTLSPNQVHSTLSPNQVYSTPTKSGNMFFPQRRDSHGKYLSRDSSFQSDDGSHCSSVEFLLESRRPDPEAVLLGLGFGPRRDSNCASRIPARFLQPSKVLKSIDINKFLEQQNEAELRDEDTLTPPSPGRLCPKSK